MTAVLTRVHRFPLGELSLSDLAEVGSLLIRVTLNMRSILLTNFKCFYTHTQTQGGTKKLLEATYMCITLIAVMVSQVYAYVQTHQIIWIKYIQFFIYPLYLNKTVLFSNPSSSRCLMCPDWNQISSFCVGFHPRKRAEKLLANTVWTSLIVTSRGHTVDTQCLLNYQSQILGPECPSQCRGAYTPD